jgi:molybdopterin-synthase adenylyltransferase
MQKQGGAMLTGEELDRYGRQIMIPQIGEKGQEKLKRAKVFIAGAGGLGSPVSIYLTAAGIGQLRIVDHDKVDLTNLNRQVAHWTADVGRRKVESAQEKLNKLNPNVTVETLSVTISEENASELTAGFDLIVDAMDNLPTRYVLNKTAIGQGVPFIHGAVNGFEGRAMTVIPGKTACLRCLYRGPVPESKFPVIGVTEVIKVLVGIGDLLVNRLLAYDGLNLKFTEFKVQRNPECEHCAHL